MDFLIKTYDLSKTIGVKLLFENISFDIFPENCIGFIGSKCCGKTKLFKIILRCKSASFGEIWQKDTLLASF